MNEQQEMPQVSKPRRPDIKKVLTVLVISLLILLPTILAIVLTLYSELHDDSTSFAGVEVVLYDKDHNELFRESGDNINNESESLVKILCAIDDNRQKHTFGGNTDTTVEPLIINIIRNGAVTELTCYFSFYSGQSWCTDQNGERYLIPDMYSEYFTHSAFAEPLYSAATPPALQTAEGNSISPQSIKWTYRNESNQWFDAVLNKTTSSMRIYTCTGGISLSFEEEPSSCTAKLYEQNAEIYSGDLEGISSVALSENMVKVSVTAVWDKQSGTAYYGEQTFSFYVRVQNKADFFISSLNISTNYPAIVCATNVEDLSALSFTSEDTSFKPEFHLRGNTAFALIPYPADAAQKQLKKFSFTLSYGVSTQTFTLMHNDLGDSVNAEVCKLLDINLDYFNSTIDQIFIGSDHATPDSEKFKVSNKFGDKINVYDTLIATPFTEYLSISGHGNAVETCYAGKVAFIGSNESLGNYLVIDLGLDVKLWYCFLGEIYVKVGDTVATGEIIGTTSSIGIREDAADGFAFMFSYRDHVISPDFVFGNDFAIIQ